MKHVLPSRRSVRLRGFDYSGIGRYFLTICSHQMHCIFGCVQDGLIVLSPVGKIAQECWCEIPKHFANVRLEPFVIMPNHVHGILTIHRGHGIAVPALPVCVVTCP